MENKVTLHFTPEDYNIISALIGTKLYKKQKKYILLALLSAALITIALLVLLIIFVEDIPSFPGETAIGFFTTLLAFSIILRITRKKGHLSPATKDGAFCRARTITINDKGIYDETEFSNSFLDWRGIHLIEHRNDHIFIYTDLAIAYAIPRSRFDSPESADQFLDYALEQHEKANLNP